MPKTSLVSEKEAPKTPEERRNKLQRTFDDIQNRNGALNSEELINKNKLKEVKTRLIRELFRMMQDLGVDPNDLSSINQFLQKLDIQNPDLRELFEVAFSKLLGDSDAVQETPAIPGAPIAPVPPGIPEAAQTSTAPGESGGLMDRFKNLAPQNLMPR